MGLRITTRAGEEYSMPGEEIGRLVITLEGDAEGITISSAEYAKTHGKTHIYVEYGANCVSHTEIEVGDA